MATAGLSVLRKQSGKVLIASSREDVRRRVQKGLPAESPVAAEAAGGADALMKLDGSDFGTLMLDTQLDDLDVGELRMILHLRFPRLNVVMLEEAKAEDPIEQLTLGLEESHAVDPLDDENANPEPATNCAEESSKDFHAPHVMRTPSQILPGMIGTGQKMQQIYRLARLVAPRDTAVLIIGATGTGKELVARGIHELSRRSRGPFVVVNCAAIPETLLEAELFGFTRGAFTGAFQSRLGRIHSAHGGTLLLDEVGELPLSMQAKLLRFVQEGEVQRLGSADLFRVDARVIAATNADLLQRVREKQFREDLYYRLAVFPVYLPALCHRPEDIVPLAEHFLALLCQKSETPAKVFSREASEVLRAHLWPGNIRELHHCVERAFVLSESRHQILAEDLDSSAQGNGIQ